MQRIDERAERALEKFKRVRDAASLTKLTLIEKWKENNAFTDMDCMRTPGLVSEAVGLTSLLLLLLAFNEDENVINEEDRAEICRLHKQSLGKIYEYVKEYGYTADPLVECDTDAAESLFSDGGYIDTITWVLSVSILSRRVDINDDVNQGGIVKLDDETRKQYMELMTSSLKLLLNAQREDGMWGFRADNESSGALYFTYSACASLADFLDYVLGEIAYTYSELSDAEMEEMRKKLRDTELLDYLDDALGIDVAEAVTDARAKVQRWLIETCMFDMPALACCDDMNGEANRPFRNRLGMWDHTTSDSELAEFVRYYNLNYTYFLVDMMVSMSADKRFYEMCAGSERARLVELCRTALSGSDKDYYLGDSDDGERIEELWKNIMEQTIHTARARFMQASRTGDLFWNRAELPIAWSHEQSRVKALIRQVYDAKAFKDPSIVPMALRANTMFCYYISEQADMSVDRLFDDILKERASVGASSKYTVGGLWDGNRYNLLVTERSIESIVDYYDYLNKFESAEAEHSTCTEGQAPAAPVCVPVKSELDIALEKKIAEYLAGEDGQRIIAEAVEARLPVAQEQPAPIVTAPTVSGGAIDIKAVTELINMLNSLDITSLSNNKSDERIQLMSALEALYAGLQRLHIRQAIHESNLDKGISGAKAEEKETKAAREISTQLDELAYAMAEDEDLDNPTHQLQFLYQHIKQLANNS